MVLLRVDTRGILRLGLVALIVLEASCVVEKTLADPGNLLFALDGEDDMPFFVVAVVDIETAGFLDFVTVVAAPDLVDILTELSTLSRAVFYEPVALLGFAMNERVNERIVVIPNDAVGRDLNCIS